MPRLEKLTIFTCLQNARSSNDTTHQYVKLHVHVPGRHQTVFSEHDPLPFDLFLRPDVARPFRWDARNPSTVDRSIWGRSKDTWLVFECAVVTLPLVLAICIF